MYWHGPPMALAKLLPAVVDVDDGDRFGGVGGHLHGFHDFSCRSVSWVQAVSASP